MRQRRVSVDCELSEEMVVNVAVNQDSVLLPFLSAVGLNGVTELASGGLICELLYDER